MMLAILANKTYRRLFFAQIIALLGTGLATIALALLAFELAGAEAGVVLGTALAIKMIAYVGVAPVAAALLERLPRRRVLVTLDLLRAGIALALPFVSEIWQIYVLIFLLQSASAAFTPTFQATIPEILPDEKEYTRALSLSRLANDLESFLSPMLAAALLTVLTYHNLFVGTAIGFLASALFVVSVVLPSRVPGEKRGLYEGTIKGVRIYLATPRLRGLLAICVAVAAGGAMVIVNTVVIVQDVHGLPQTATALAMSVFGAGSMVAALALPRLLDRLHDRPVMIGAALLMAISLAAGLIAADFAVLLPLWFLLGLGFAAAQTPAGRLLNRSSRAEDRQAVFAAQFALSHACWLVTYPLAGWLGSAAGIATAFAVLAAIAGGAVILALYLWPRAETSILEHVHDDLPDDDPHWRDGKTRSGHRHSHAFVIDDLHPEWPREP